MGIGSDFHKKGVHFIMNFYLLILALNFFLSHNDLLNL